MKTIILTTIIDENFDTQIFTRIESAFDEAYNTFLKYKNITDQSIGKETFKVILENFGEYKNSNCLIRISEREFNLSEGSKNVALNFSYINISYSKYYISCIDSVFTENPKANIQHHLIIYTSVVDHQFQHDKIERVYQTQYGVQVDLRQLIFKKSLLSGESFMLDSRVMSYSLKCFSVDTLRKILFALKGGKFDFI